MITFTACSAVNHRLWHKSIIRLKHHHQHDSSTTSHCLCACIYIHFNIPNRICKHTQTPFLKFSITNEALTCFVKKSRYSVHGVGYSEKEPGSSKHLLQVLTVADKVSGVLHARWVADQNQRPSSDALKNPQLEHCNRQRERVFYTMNMAQLNGVVMHDETSYPRYDQNRHKPHIQILKCIQTQSIGPCCPISTTTTGLFETHTA